MRLTDFCCFRSIQGGPWQGDVRTPAMTPELHEGKYELDSLAAFLRLSNLYYDVAGQTDCFSGDWGAAVALAIETTIRQQAGTSIRDPYFLYLTLFPGISQALPRTTTIRRTSSIG